MGIAAIIEARPRDLGGFTVGRVLPAPTRRHVGPFLFLDHMGPVVHAPGQGMDVRPHPHIGLATVTYLFEGEIHHRDSLGMSEVIRPGEVNWMTAGRGIVHSERTPPEMRARGQKVHGLQLWCSLPAEHEETEPSFQHYGLSDLKSVELEGGTARVVVGSAFGATSDVRTLVPTWLVDLELEVGARLTVPADYAERAAYVVEGEVDVEGDALGERKLGLFAIDREAELCATTKSRVVLLGGATPDGPRHIEWNFVSSSQGRIEQAKADWRGRRFPSIPGDDVEFIPLPE
jgi:redox-sensitive bicupin YhaK (pirin superfamily)